MFRYSHLQNLPEIFNKYFNLADNEIHNYNTRNAAHKSCARTNYKKHMLAINDINIWNNSYEIYEEKYLLQ